MDNQYSCLPNRQSITGVADRSIFAPSLCGEGRGGAASKARGDPQGLFYSRGDPPPESNARGDPPWIYASRGDPPDLIRARGHPPEPYLARGRPPNAQEVRNSSFEQELIFRILGSQNRLHGRAMVINEQWSIKNECQKMGMKQDVWVQSNRCLKTTAKDTAPIEIVALFK